MTGEQKLAALEAEAADLKHLINIKNLIKSLENREKFTLHFYENADINLNLAIAQVYKDFYGIEAQDDK
ncbi:MAG: hypothetical protein LW696_07675 [Alphaproteobacteria bacterium]|jgi:hypothetical protein|nr:hypothetical protein [Alphaproteobacteria bacterium]